MPAVPEGDEGQGPDIGAQVVTDERPSSPQMADRVDAPRDVMEERHPDETSPQERRERTEESSRQAPPDEERESERGHGQQREKSIDHDEVPVPMEFRSESLGVGGVRGEQPAHVGPQETFQRGDRAGSVAMRGVRVTGLVSEHVMPTMY